MEKMEILWRIKFKCGHLHVIKFTALYLNVN